MKKTIALIGMIALLASSLTVVAAENTGAESTAVTVTTPDGVLSVEVSKDEWKEKEDSGHWFEITDGKNSIMIDHLANGESLPDVKMAAEENEEICQTFISTKNEVFIVTGLADSREAFEDVIKTVGTIRILKYDTKTAIQKETQNAQTTQSGINAINATYYVTTDELNVRSAPSSDSEVVGSLYKGEAVTVIGAVTKDGADTGWYQIQYTSKTKGWVLGSLSEVIKEETKATTSAKKAAKQVEIIESPVRVRESPSITAKKVGSTSEGKKYKYLATKKDEKGRTWYQIQYNVN